MVDECVNKLINEDFTCCSLFNLPILDKKQYIKNDFNRDEVIENLYNKFIKDSDILNKII